MMSPPLEVKCKPYPEDTGSTRALPTCLSLFVTPQDF